MAKDTTTNNILPPRGETKVVGEPLSGKAREVADKFLAQKNDPNAPLSAIQERMQSGFDSEATGYKSLGLGHKPQTMCNTD